MGIWSSKPEVKTPVIETPEFETPWRTVTWGKAKKDSLIEDIRKIQPCTTHLKCLRIIVVGPAGAGKSSFINSVNNAFQGRITSNALSDAIGSGISFTRKYSEFEMKTGNLKLSTFFNDVMGLEIGSEKGCHPDDIFKAIHGFMKNGHMFNPEKPISPEDPDYIKNPNLSDETYCMVYVLAADRIKLAKDEIFKKLRNIRKEVSTTWGLPQIIVVTNVDQACPLVQKKLQKIYLSKKIREIMEWCSISLGVPMCHVFPVKNYHEEIETNDDMDVLILQAFKQIMELANDNVEIRIKNKDGQNVRGKTVKI